MACGCKKKSTSKTLVKKTKAQLGSVNINFNKPTKTKEQLREELRERIRRING